MPASDLICEEREIHENVVASVRAELPEDGQLFSLADFFKAFADSTRIKILCALEKKEMCVCDIAELLGITVSAVSHQLRLLRDADLVRPRREGKTVFYSLADDHVKAIIDCGMEHILE